LVRPQTRILDGSVTLKAGSYDRNSIQEPECKQDLTPNS